MKKIIYYELGNGKVPSVDAEEDRERIFGGVVAFFYESGVGIASHFIL